MTCQQQQAGAQAPTPSPFYHIQTHTHSSLTHSQATAQLSSLNVALVRCTYFNEVNIIHSKYHSANLIQMDYIEELFPFQILLHLPPPTHKKNQKTILTWCYNIGYFSIY